MTARLFALLIAAAFAVPTPAAAQDPLPQAAIRTGDLDLSSTAGRETFDRRLRSAADQRCGRDDRSLLSSSASAECRKTMLANGHAQMAALESQREAAAQARARAEVRAQMAARQRTHARYAARGTAHHRARRRAYRHRVHHWHRPVHRAATAQPAH